MKTEKTTRPTPVHLEEAPVPTLTRLIQVVPSTSVFAGWGPRIDTSMHDIMRGRN